MSRMKLENLTQLEAYYIETLLGLLKNIHLSTNSHKVQPVFWQEVFDNGVRVTSIAKAEVRGTIGRWDEERSTGGRFLLAMAAGASDLGREQSRSPHSD
ncbi:unnamed protein product [Protopolystoma xenopodis]|uniref:Uncharacterized protein n=1 Tax=Protopolystoma xenopodis TaxID=117903 RepID=A0A448X9L0_9PLAT|nr:unnamed protein product [Protopolystoma xenopodis]